MDNIINNAIKYVEKFFEKDYSGHDFYHTLRVYNLSKKIAENEKCDEEILYLTALLHDVDDYKLVGEKSKKFENAVGFLKSQNYPENKIEIICHNISQISFKGKDSVIPDTIEGKIAQDADRLDALGAIGIARAFTYGGNKNRAIYIPEQKYKDNMTEEEYYSNNGATINHFYEKILKIKEMLNTKTANSIAKHRHEYVELYLKEFFDEWDGTN